MQGKSPRGRFLRVLVLTVVVAGVIVSTAAALRFTDDSYKVPDGEVGTPYSHRFEGVGGSPPHAFHVTSGSLPPGLTLSSSGQVSGTPTASGSFSFWVELSDTWCPSHPETPCAQRQFQINVAPDLRITTEAAPSATIEVPYGLKVGWVGGGDIVWSVVAGALPPGLTLDQTGLIQGTPTTLGSYTFTLLITHERRSDTKTLTIPVRRPIAFVPAEQPKAEVGVPLTPPFELEASGGSEQYTWVVDPATLPRGLVLEREKASDDDSDTPEGASEGAWVLTGTPRVAGAFPVTLTVSDTEGRSAKGQVIVRIEPRLRVGTKRLPLTKVGNTYRVQLRTIGGVAPFRWKAVKGEGRFPPGVRLNKKLGLLVGKPRKPGVYRFVLEARDGLKVTAKRKFAIAVKPKPKK